MGKKPVKCALPECDRIITQPPGGGPRRKYCGPAHRAEARRQRRSLADTVTTPSPRTAAAETQGGSKPHGAVDDPTGAYPAKRPPATAHPRRMRRGVAASAVLVSFGIAGGVSSTAPLRPAADGGPATRYATGQPNGPNGPHGSPPPATPAPDPLLAESTNWSYHANRTLRLIHGQLATLSHAQKTARAVPASRRTRELVHLMRELNHRIATLRRQQATLRTELAVRDLYQRSTSQLTAVQNALQQAHQASQPNTPQVAGVPPDLTSALTSQQHALVQQVGQWSAGLRQAMNQPLPLPVASTPDLARRTVDAATRPLPTPAPPSTAKSPAPVAPPRPISVPRPRHTVPTATAPPPARHPVEPVSLDSRTPVPTAAVQQHAESTTSPASPDDSAPTRDPSDDTTAPVRNDRAVHTDHPAEATDTHDDCSGTEHARDDRDESHDRHDDGESAHSNDDSDHPAPPR